MTAALMAAGTGSAFAAAPAQLSGPATALTCPQATAALGDARTGVVTAERNRDDARRELRRARADLEKAQAPYDTALRQRDAAQERLKSRQEREARRNAAVIAAEGLVKSWGTALDQRKAEVTAIEGKIKTEPSPANRWRLQRDLRLAQERVGDAERALRSAERDRGRAHSEFISARGETAEADARFNRKQAAFELAKPADDALHNAVTLAGQKLQEKEIALVNARGDRRTARDAREQVCTDDVSTLPQPQPA